MYDFKEIETVDPILAEAMQQEIRVFDTFQ